MLVRKLLFVTEVFPHPLDRGDRVRISNLLQACARDFDVTLVVPRQDSGAAETLPAGVTRVVFVKESFDGGASASQWFRAIRSGIGLPRLAAVRHRLAFIRALDELDLRNFDLIWAERPPVGLLFGPQRSRTIVDLDDVEHLRLKRLLSMQGVSRAWVHNLYKYLVYRRTELRSFRRFRQLIVCTEHDRGYLQMQRAGDVNVVPNGAVVPAEARTPRVRRPGLPLRGLFLGNMGHGPNEDAVRFLADEVCPATKGIVGSMEVIGSNASDALREHASGHIVFRGFVPDLADAMESFDVLVAPVRYGGGTKLKLIEAMANGLPIVATPCAAEGLDLVSGQHILLASTAEEFGEALSRLMHSPELGQHLAAAAFAHARERFSWDSIQANLAADLAHVGDSDPLVR